MAAGDGCLDKVAAVLPLHGETDCRPQHAAGGEQVIGAGTDKYRVAPIRGGRDEKPSVKEEEPTEQLGGRKWNKGEERGNEGC